MGIRQKLISMMDSFHGINRHKILRVSNFLINASEIMFIAIYFCAIVPAILSAIKFDGEGDRFGINWCEESGFIISAFYILYPLMVIYLCFHFSTIKLGEYEAGPLRQLRVSEFSSKLVRWIILGSDTKGYIDISDRRIHLSKKQRVQLSRGLHILVFCVGLSTTFDFRGFSITFDFRGFQTLITEAKIPIIRDVSPYFIIASCILSIGCLLDIVTNVAYAFAETQIAKELNDIEMVIRRDYPDAINDIEEELRRDYPAITIDSAAIALNLAISNRESYTLKPGCYYTNEDPYEEFSIDDDFEE